jgi:hypothetical protein
LFNSIAKTAASIYILNKTMHKFANSKLKQERLSKLVNKLGRPMSLPNLENCLAALVIALLVGTKDISIIIEMF